MFNLKALALAALVVPVTASADSLIPVELPGYKGSALSFTDVSSMIIQDYRAAHAAVYANCFNLPKSEDRYFAPVGIGSNSKKCELALEFYKGATNALTLLR